MKTKILIFSILLISMIGKAQITLDMKFKGVSNCFVANGEVKYINISGNNQLTIYNSDYSIYKSNPINIEHYTATSIFFPSDKLFNSDNLIEFIVSGSEFDSMMLYNENAVKLMNFGQYQNASLILDNNKTKLYVSDKNDNWGDMHSSAIYSLPGIYIDAITKPSNKILIKTTSIQSESVYPNPSHTIINLPYSLSQGQMTTMNIYDIDGKLIDQKTIDSNFDRILLNVENYPAGVYFYEVNGKSSKFVVNK